MEVPPPGLPCDNQRSEFIGNARLLHTGNLLIVAQSWEVLSRANSLVLFGRVFWGGSFADYRSLEVRGFWGQVNRHELHPFF